MTNEIDILVIHSLAVLADAHCNPAIYGTDPKHQRAYTYAQDIVRQVAADALRKWEHLK